MLSPQQPTPSPRTYTRELYSVEDTRVIFEDGRGWHCECRTHTEHGRCTHVEKAQVFRQMRGVRKEDDTIELELNTSQLQSLLQAAAEDRMGLAELDADRAPTPPETARPPRQRSRWENVLAAAAIAALSSGITYMATSHAETDAVSTPVVAMSDTAVTAEPEAAVAPSIPVQFTNPFDASEIFEFPAGTTDTDAQSAVAEFLLQRARDRIGSRDARRRGGKSGDHTNPVRSASVAQRS